MDEINRRTGRIPGPHCYFDKRLDFIFLAEEWRLLSQFAVPYTDVAFEKAEAYQQKKHHLSDAECNRFVRFTEGGGKAIKR